MNILALDTASSTCSAALSCGGTIIDITVQPEARQQTQAIIPLLQDLLDKAGQDIDKIDLFAVTTGPGSFTGVRVGLATMRGLALAASKPLIGFSGFEVAASGVTNPKGSDILVALDSRRPMPYTQLFSSTGEAISEAVEFENEQDLIDSFIDTRKGELVATGDGIALLSAAKSLLDIEEPSESTARILLTLAIKNYSDSIMPERPHPFYLRPADAIKSKNIRNISSD